MNFDSRTLFLIDGSSFLYRAYYSMKPLHSPKGEPVQAVYGFCRMLKKLINQFDPKNMLLVWDSRGATIRHEIFPDYKATRQAPPTDLGQQKALIKEFADKINLAQIEKQGIEADDLIFSSAKEFSRNYKIVIISSDKDLYQLLDNDKIFVFDPFKDEIFDQKKYEEKLGYSIKKLPFYFSLLGDTSDNIPGVRGIGKKGATDLVQEFDSLEDLYNNLARVKKISAKNALEENRDNAFLSLKLFLLRYEPTNLDQNQIKFDIENWNNATEFFERLNFQSLLTEVGKKTKTNSYAIKIPFSTTKGYKFRTVISKEDLESLINYLKEKKIFAVDTETTGIDTFSNDIVGVSFCAEIGKAFYIPIAHKNEKLELSKAEIINAIKPILEDPEYKKILHNAKFDSLVFAKENINLNEIVFDTIIAASLLSGENQRIGLDKLSEFYLNDAMLTYNEVVNLNKYENFAFTPVNLATQYAAADAHQSFVLKELFEKLLEEKHLKNLFNEIEMPLMSVLTDIEKSGICLDVNILKELEVLVDIELSAIEKKISALLDATELINLNSPKQVEELLFVKLKLPPQKKSGKKTGYSTDQEVLETLSYLHPIPGLILKYREFYKLKSTYITSLPNYVAPDKKIHTNFNQTSTATGRLASSDPNLQNIPASSSVYAQKLRGAFKADPGTVFISADYSQIELRVLAYLSKDKNLENSFLQDLDIHAITASKLFDTELEKITNEQRQVGKRINFSILYGLTPYGLSKDLNIPFSDAKIYIEKYFAQYPEVQNWMNKIVEETKEKGYVETYWGRRRYISGIYERNKSLYELAKRVAVNTVAQGTAAEIMKNGMIKLSRELQDAKILLQIHDELLIAVPEDKAYEMELKVKNILENIVNWSVPLKVTTRVGKTWQEVSK
ncbi:DNA polymerase I [candidate division TM6 bacterium RIFCSPHIGHO2_12_FULL_32_22]|nr:MAG: DNA polymerase I [candidate division TM6 bacterium RIFCSPHIGHO2_12_FULL_32_22]